MSLIHLPMLRVPIREARGPDREDCDGFEIGDLVNGNCDTDGHYRCVECVHISQKTLRQRQERCVDCGTPLVPGIPRLGYSSREPDCCPSCQPNDVAIKVRPSVRVTHADLAANPGLAAAHTQAGSVVEIVDDEGRVRATFMQCGDEQ